MAISESGVPAPSGRSPQQRALRLSVAEGALHAVMIGVGESYLGALAVELGHQDLALALLVTVPLLAGAVAQLASGFLVSVLGSRRLVIVGASLQAASHLALAAIALFGHNGLWSLLLAKTAFWVSGAVITPPWNAWMTRLTDGIDKPRYFARRSGIHSVALLVAFLSAGSVLETAREAGHVFSAFASLLIVGLLARTASAILLAFQQDSPPPPTTTSPATRLVNAARTSQWRVAVFVSLVMFGAQVAVPFFTPFMLRELRLGYGAYSGLLAVSILAKAIAYPLFDRVIKVIGLRGILLFSGVGVAIVPMVWVSASSLTELIFIQTVGGIVWAGFEFAHFQLLMGSATEDCRVEFFALAGTGTGLAQLGGSMIGSHLLDVGAVDYRGVFALSALLRAAPLALLVSPWLTAVAARTPFRRIFVRIGSVRPEAGVVRTPIIEADESKTRARH